MASTQQDCSFDIASSDSEFASENYEENRENDTKKWTDQAWYGKAKANISSKKSKVSNTIGTKNHLKSSIQADKMNKTLVGTNADNSSSKYEIPWKEALFQASVSDIIDNLCSYQCPKCKVIYITGCSLIRHFKRTKHVIFKRGNLKNYLTKITAYKCQICSMRVLCDKAVMKDHLRDRHQIVCLAEYSQQTNGKYVDKKRRKSYKDENEFRLAYSDNYEISQSIGNLCSFSCTKCSFTCTYWKTMTRHVTKNKHGSILSPEKYVTKATVHICQVCKEVVLCDNQLLTAHFSIHNIRTSQYKKEKLGQKFDEPLFLTQYLYDLKAQIQNIPALNPKSNCVLKAGSLSNDQVTKDVGNLSFFKCLICFKSDMSFNCFVSHYINKHKEKVSYRIPNVVEARYHKCHVCQKIILCDLAMIRSHIRDNHSLKTIDYFENHVLKNGGRVYHSFKEYLKNNHQICRTVKNSQKSAMNPKSFDANLIQPSDLSSESEDSDYAD